MDRDVVRALPPDWNALLGAAAQVVREAPQHHILGVGFPERELAKALCRMLAWPLCRDIGISRDFYEMVRSSCGVRAQQEQGFPAGRRFLRPREDDDE